MLAPPFPRILEDAHNEDFSDLLEIGHTTGEPIGDPPLCINTNHLS